MRFAALLLAAIALAGCAAGGAQPHVLRIAYSADPGSLDPLTAVDQDIIGFDLLFCQTLVGLSVRNEVVPVLVTRVPSRQNGDVSPDGLRITYHLRPENRFADGRPLTSADVAFTYAAIRDPRNRAASLGPYAHVASLETPDPLTVVVRLKKPWAAAVTVLFAQADYAYGILPKHAFADTKVFQTPWEERPFGSGPFRVVEWRRGDRIVLEPNPYYSPRPKLARIVMSIVPNLNSNFVELQSGAVDVAELDPENAERATGLTGIRVVRTPENGTAFIYLQNRASPTDDLHVRRAIAYALDLGALQNAWRHAYPPAASFLAPPVVRWPSVKISPYPHDPAAAARELDAAGWRLHGTVREKDGVALDGTIGARADDPINVRIATLVQAQLAAVGFSLDLKPQPTRLWFSYSGLLRNGKATMVSETWLGGSDPEQSVNLRCANAVAGSDNHSFYCSKLLDALYDDQMRALSEKRRDRDFDAMQLLVHRDVPVIPLYYEVLIEGVNTRVTGYAKNMLRFPVDAENWDAK